LPSALAHCRAKAATPLTRAAIMAANEKFQAEFKPTRYDSQGEPMETLLADIKNL